MSILEPVQATPEQQVLETLRVLNVSTDEIERYGDHPNQFIEWYGPADGDTVCFVHAGDFRGKGDLAYARPAAFALGEAGYRVGLANYRREEGDPTPTFFDMTTLARLPELADAIWLGHCIGGALVLNVVLDAALPPSSAVLLAPVIDMMKDASESDDGGAIARWLGGLPDAVDYSLVDPWLRYQEIGPEGIANRNIHIEVIHGLDDSTVPVERTRALADEPFNVAVVPGANHMDVIRPDHDAWLLLLGALRKNSN